MKKSASLIKSARRLRRSQTDAEKALWAALRTTKAEHKFRRQHPVGPYVADFICVEKSLIIELDGGQHTVERDAVRTDYLEQKGYQVLRFWNDEVLKNPEGVYNVIKVTLTRS